MSEREQLARFYTAFWLISVVSAAASFGAVAGSVGGRVPFVALGTLFALCSVPYAVLAVVLKYGGARG